MSALKIRFLSYSAVANMVLLGILGSVRPACSVHDPETCMLAVVIGRSGIGVVVFNHPLLWFLGDRSLIQASQCLMKLDGNKMFHFSDMLKHGPSHNQA